MYSIIFLAAMSFLACLALTPAVRIVFRWHGIVDMPNARRKLHPSPVPRTGGVAIVGAYLIAVGLLLVTPLNGADAVNVPLILRLLPAAGVVFLTGLLDDLVGLKPWEKILGQVAAGCLAYFDGVQVAAIAGFVMPGWWSLPVTIAWMVACTNAFNLIDGVDGLATGVGLFATFTTLAAALLQNNIPLALATAPLFGALLAFLRYNFNPASIFLGDCGSLTIGFVLGCFGAIWSQKSATALGMTAPLMALAVPLLDTAVAIARRFIRRQRIFGADRNHIHHRLLDRGFSQRKVVLVLYGVCGIAASFSLLQSMPHNKFHGLLLVVFCAAAWVGVQLVGYAEFDLAKALVLSGTFRDIVNARLFVATFERGLAVAVTDDDYWQTTRDASRELGCTEVRMFLGDRTYDERMGDPDPNQCCTIRIPIAGAGYVNFRYPSNSAVWHAVAIASIVESIQRALAGRAVHDVRRRIVTDRPAAAYARGPAMAIVAKASANRDGVPETAA